MPLSFLMQYLEDQTGGKAVILGVQPQNIMFGEGLTPEIEEISRKLIIMIDSILTTHLRGKSNVSND
jgi:Ni,Fe-hydrogenase maturation factor